MAQTSTSPTTLFKRLSWPLLCLLMLLQLARAGAFALTPADMSQAAGALGLAISYLLVIPVIQLARPDLAPGIAGVCFLYLALFALAQYLAPAHADMLGVCAAGTQLGLVIVVLLHRFGQF